MTQDDRATDGATDGVADGAHDEREVDDDWDWDTELGLLDPWPDPPVRRRWVPPAPYVRPPRVRDEQVVELGTGDAGELVRACRAVARLSQRELAVAAGVPHSTVARIEAAGHSAAPRLDTVVRLATACGVRLVGVLVPDGQELAAAADGTELLRTDREQRHRDAAGRMLPAHLVNEPLLRTPGDWWGDDRYTHGRRRPSRSFGRRSRYAWPPWLPEPPSTSGDPAPAPPS